jgi:hypothetical protein
LKIDAPIDDLCNEISVAPQALRTALEASYKVEMREGVLTPSNISDHACPKGAALLRLKLQHYFSIG